MKDKKLRSIQMRNMRDTNITFGSSITNSNPNLLNILDVVIINNNKPFFLYHASYQSEYIYMYAELSSEIVRLLSRGEVDSVRFNLSDNLIFKTAAVGYETYDYTLFRIITSSESTRDNYIKTVLVTQGDAAVIKSPRSKDLFLYKIYLSSVELFKDNKLKLITYFD
jgi:hypothetical protein